MAKAARRASNGGGHGGPTPAALMAERLAESGLTDKHAKQLGLEALGPAQVAMLDAGFEPGMCAMKIPYWRADKPTEPLRGWPKHPAFYRLRYLGQRPAGFGRITKQQRYAQPDGEPSCAYFPRFTDWNAVNADPKVDLLITEGEIKAAKACLEGLPCVGLGGVWSFRSSRFGIHLLPELLQDVAWIKRRVFLVYDSDARTNPDVVKAARMLGQALMDLGAYPHYVWLPDALDGQGKTGLDDFLVRAGPDELDKLLDLAQPFTLSQPLWEMNERLVYVMSPGLILDEAGDHRWSKQQFTDAMSNVSLVERVPDDNGDFKLKPRKAAEGWMGWPLRRQVQRMTYAPGKDKFTEDGAYNTWTGWGVEPAEGDVKPYLDLVEHLMTGATKAELDWFHDWWCYQIQNPGCKLHSALVMHTPTQGVGKNFLGEIWGKVYGRNYRLITNKEIHGSFNGWMEGKQFIHGDEISASDRRQDADLLKGMITQEKVEINIKHVPQYEVPDFANYLFTSNHPDAFFLSDQDRRFFVWEIIVQPLPKAFYIALREWKNGAGPAALMHWALKRKISKDFTPTGEALRTAAKDRMIADGRSDVGDWVARLREDPDAVLCVGAVVSPRALWSSAELRMLYDPEDKRRITVNGFGRELKKAGFRQVNEGKPLRWLNGQDRYFAVRDADKWLAMTTVQLRAHLEGDPVVGKSVRRKFER